MLDHLRQHIAATLAAEPAATLSTAGPAGLQAIHTACVAVGLRLLLPVPRTADLLLNLEHERAVVVTSPRWQVRGLARLLDDAERPAALTAPTFADAAWHAVVEIRPTRVAIAHPTGWGSAETFDLDVDDM